MVLIPLHIQYIIICVSLILHLCSGSDITHPPVLKEAPPPANRDNSSSIKEVPPADITNDVIPTSNGEIPTHSDYINAKVIVYSALSGMVSFLPDGTIHGCNHHFSLMLFGYSQEELLRKVRTYVLLCLSVVLCYLAFLSEHLMDD